MTFTISSSALLSHLQAISRVINSKSPIHILDCFLFEIQDNKLSLTASDNDNTMETTIELVESSANCRFALSSKMILDALKEIPEQPLAIMVNEDTLEIKIDYMNGEYVMMGQSADEYPSAPVMSDDSIKFTISSQQLLEGITCSIFAAADDEIRPVMCGIYFDITPESLTMVASDGHKLVRCRDYSITDNAKSAFILPKKPSTLVKNLLAKDSGSEVAIEFDDRFAIFNMSNYRLVSRLIEGRYPNYNSVIPQGNPHKMTIDRQAFIGALRRVSIFSSQASLIKLRLSENNLVISAQDVDFSTSAQESLSCQYNGAPMNIGFRASFLIDLLGNLPGTEVVVELADPSRAGVIVPFEHAENMELLMLLMPMMLTD